MGVPSGIVAPFGSALSGRLYSEEFAELRATFREDSGKRLGTGRTPA